MFNSLSDKRISLERLRRFCEVADAGTVAVAADRNNRSQPSYSRDIAALEDFFGADLFITTGKSRSGRALQGLTPRGEHLRQVAVDCFEALAALIEFEDAPTAMRIGAGETAMQWVISRHLSEIRSTQPNAQLQLVSMASREVLNGIETGELDIGVVEARALDSASANIASIEIGELSYSLYLSEDMLERTRPTSEAHLVADIPLAGMADVSKSIRMPSEEGGPEGYRVEFAVLVTSYPQMAAVVATGEVAGILPHVAEEDMTRYGLVRVNHPHLNSLSIPISLIWDARRAELNPSLAQAASRIAGILTIST